MLTNVLHVGKRRDRLCDRPYSHQPCGARGTRVKFQHYRRHRIISDGGLEMGMALQGIRVLDWTQFQAGPVAGMLLGDLGADVIKVEERAGGDLGRGVVGTGGKAFAAMERNPYFEIGNRNKRSITLDLRKEAGREIMYRLAEKADVFLHNFRQKAAEDLGMHYEALRQRNPRLIYAQVSGWGPKGPDKDEPGFDPAALARSGFWSIVTEPGCDFQYLNGAFADQMAGMTAAFGVLAALFARQATGRGQRVDASILGGMSHLVAYPLTFYTLWNRATAFVGRKSAWNPLYNQYKCADGRWISIVLVPPDKYWPALCRAAGLEHLENDPRFSSMFARNENARELIAILDERMATKPSEEWTSIFRAHKLVFGRINTVEEFADDPQAIANDYVTSYEHPIWKKVRVAGFPVTYSDTPCSIRREAPEFGQHTEEVLMEALNLSWDDIGRLKEQEVI